MTLRSNRFTYFLLQIDRAASSRYDDSRSHAVDRGTVERVERREGEGEPILYPDAGLPHVCK